MSNYLQGFLAIVPEYERKQVEKFLTENRDVYEIQAVNEEQFEELLALIQKELKKITVLVKQGDKVDAESFNQFHSAVDVDMQRLYAQHLRTETVVANYDRILNGLLEDMYREVNNLRQRVQELDMKAKGEQGLIVVGYGFEEEKRSEFMETDHINYDKLFCDRDPMATRLTNAALVRDFHQHYLTLPITNKVDCMKDSTGNVTASVKVVERHGIPVVDISHGIDMAGDASDSTFWVESIVSDAPIVKATMLKTNVEE